MKKVLLISVRSDVGGGPQHVYDLMKYGTPEKVSFFVAAPDEEPFGSLFKSLAKGFLQIPHRKFSPISFIKILIFIKNNDISVVHSHGLGAGIYSRLLGLFGLKVIHTFHGVHKPKSLLGKVKVFLERSFTLLTDKALFVSQSERVNAIDCGFNLLGNDAVICNGIELDDIIIKRNPTIKSICILSRFDPHKNVKRAITLFSKLLRDYPNLMLNIAGAGEDDQLLRTHVKTLNIESNVKFVGFISNSLEFLKENDIYLSTSKGEGLPYTVLEAMKVGTLPLLSNVSGHKDILTKDYLFELDDDAEFITKFQALCAGKEHDFKVILERDFEIEKQIKKVVEVYS